MVFEYGDDLWFLRLCLLTTGKVIKNVHWRIGQKIVKKLTQIKLMGCVEGRILEYIEVGCLKNNAKMLRRADLETWGELKQWLDDVVRNGEFQLKSQQGNYLLGTNKIFTRAVWLLEVVTQVIDRD